MDYALLLTLKTTQCSYKKPANQQALNCKKIIGYKPFSSRPKCAKTGSSFRAFVFEFSFPDSD